MDRREALKKLGLSFGFLVGAPTALSILQGCSGTGTATMQKPKFFNEEELEFITRAVDIILPATSDTPSASEVNVPAFIDQYIYEVVSLEEQDLTKEYIGKVIEKLKNDSSKDEVSQLNDEDIEPLIANSLSKSQEEEQQIHQQINNYIEAKQNGEEVELLDDVASFALLTNLRGLSIWSYKTSEKVGEEVLAYDPIPGGQQGCVDVQEATGGKAWSL